MKDEIYNLKIKRKFDYAYCSSPILYAEQNQKIYI